MRNGKYRIITSMLVFITVFVTVGLFMRARMTQLLYHYIEKQVANQANVLSELVRQRFDMELRNMEKISGGITRAETENGSIMDQFGEYMFSDGIPGMQPGLLTPDGRALYGMQPDYAKFTGIQDSFRGNSAVSFCEREGLLFTVPVYRGSNVRYVYYRLYDVEAFSEEFFTECFDGKGDVALIDVEEREIIPFKEHNFDGIYANENVYAAYLALQDRMNVASAAAVHYKEDDGEQFMFVAEVSGYGVYLIGLVPDVEISGGLTSLITLILWVFALLILLMAIGIAHLFNAEERAKESDELRMAKLAAENASRSKSVFLANMSHEIRTPINAIMGMNEMVLRECTDRNIRKYAVNIKRASRSLLALINDVLDLSKIESGKMEIVPENYRLDALISDVISMVQGKADQKGLEFRVEVEESLPNNLYGDEVRNRQILVNLLNNAVKYTQEGSVCFRICADGCDAGQVLLHISISDTGIGIKEEDMGKLFGNFERLDLQKNRNIEGTGLGLAITKKLTEAMGGRIEAASEYGKGTVFTVYLPQKVVDGTPVGTFEKSIDTDIENQEVYRESFTAPEARILVVDDNEMNLMVVKSLLKRTQVQVFLCRSGEQCLALLQKEHFHVIMIDHMMPGMDGIEVLKRSKALEGNLCRDVPVIALTANAIKGVKEMYISEGFDDYLSKPVESSELEKMLVKYLPAVLVHEPPEGTGQAQEGKNDANDIIDVKEIQEQDIERKKIKENEDKDESALLDHKLALMYCAGSEEIYQKILRIYCNAGADRKEILKRHAQRQEWEDYRVEIHSLKSSSLNVGCRKLYDAALKLERACRTGDISYVTKNHDQCMQLYDSVIMEGKRYLENAE